MKQFNGIKSHTKEMWGFKKVPSGNFFIYPQEDIRNSKASEAIAGVSLFPNGEENAERICACVNACVGITNEELAEISKEGGMLTPRQQIADLAKMREQLIEGLERLSEAFMPTDHWQGVEIHDTTMKLIEKAKNNDY
jgi:hypothetical protein